jgi:serine protein kinase
MANELLQQLIAAQDTKHYRDLTWEGSFEEYLELVRKDPRITQTAFQRIYNMILSYGVEEYTENKDSITSYKFFSDPFDECSCCMAPSVPRSRPSCAC